MNISKITRAKNGFKTPYYQTNISFLTNIREFPDSSTTLDISFKISFNNFLSKSQ